MSSSEWKGVCLGDIGKIITGKTPSTKIKDNFGENYPFITPRDIKEQKNIIETERYLSEKGLKSVRNQVLNGISICVSCIGSDMGKVIIAKGKCVTNQQINAITSVKEEYNPDFIYYKLKPMKKYFHKIAEGSTMPIINKLKFSDIKIKVPELEEQKQIATILSSLDDKIELNNQINKNLEEISQAIFKHWFINFEFPDENGEPYKSSGGEMIDSELGPIPTGWRYEKLANLLSVIVTGNRPKGGVSKYKKGIPSIGAESINGLCNYDFSKTKYIPESYFRNMKKGVVKNGDILLYKDGAKLGRKSMFLEDFPFKRCCINSHVFILRSNSSMKQSYLFFYLDQEFMIKNIINLNTNSAQPGINSTSVKTLKILLPSENILNLFNELVSPTLRIIFSNAKENQCLSNIRDTLLPKLMSGEIRVPVNSKVLISKNN